MQFLNDLFVFIYPVTCKIHFQIFSIFIEINVNIFLLCAHLVMTIIILILEDLISIKSLLRTFLSSN